MIDSGLIITAAVQILMARIEENPLSDWATLLKQIVRAALDCQGDTYDFVA